jgi:hypothetical protein
MNRPAIATVWAAVIVVGIAASLLYLFAHGQCDNTTCGPNWLRQFLIILVGAGVIFMLLVLALGRNNRR